MDISFAHSSLLSSLGATQDDFFLLFLLLFIHIFVIGMLPLLQKKKAEIKLQKKKKSYPFHRRLGTESSANNREAISGGGGGGGGGTAGRQIIWREAVFDWRDAEEEGRGGGRGRGEGQAGGKRGEGVSTHPSQPSPCGG